MPIQLKLSSGLNILVGPNDAGKSAISDAARYVLWTRGDDYVRPDEQDFHVDADGRRGRDFVVRCTFDGLSADEEARFLEWCTNEKGKLRLHVCMRGSRRISPGGGSVVASQHRAGAEAEGLPLDGGAARISEGDLSEALAGRRACDRLRLLGRVERQ